MRQFTSISVGCWLAAGLLLGGFASRSLAQTESEPRSPKQSVEPDLTEGLLDLVNEASKASSPTPTPGKKAESQLVPSDVGLQGEDLGERSSSPLQSVRQSMLIAAGLIQRGATGTDTQRLQTDIVQRLDELIEQLEKTPRNQEPPPSEKDKQQREQTSQMEQDQSSTRQSRQNRPSTSESQEQTQNASDNQQQPGVQGRQINSEVGISDPKALQEDVWGHLPERLRTQMQSKMVEQFLPSYREQIEAYFRALLEDR